MDYSLNLKEKDAASGIDILKEIEKRNKAILVIMLSSKKRYGTVTKIILYDAVHYVIKS